ncbi:uncharacterized protein ACA1_155800 [Acanthamoeba castellanii str. Neff]|uniref:Uncharacterized protein n=1 Tax=Acanthamoeba castellanii (strain ATCC 30010 / Neff) TaxID=1257118 RepID=L8H0A0_ACACF|nr:uncharacterized protein ACA1_155800 [Acanthamoeba castellanii str. Neff]ELR18622.1 hypothetical protein ACA1_155800 [Acanthamoeba castellanii str. Neff]
MATRDDGTVGSANNPNEERTSIKSLHEEFDEAGERVPPKELFKRLCHRFHGRTPGKRKTEAKRRNLERTKRQKRCRSVDSVPNNVHVTVGIHQQYRRW